MPRNFLLTVRKNRIYNPQHMGRRRRQTYESLGEYLDDWCRIGKTQSEFAAQFGISVGYLSDLKNGKVQPSLTLAKRLSEYCHIPIEAFIITPVNS